ncbi:hypothetical protein [Actinoplanes sp. TFC3]|uniref:hypothetical protein n=1 Tax=Actinoplanes sp. TFC3 TaxID=1710355 RepID=UPI0012907CBC|nr:hypothetical protein [Actinoplanes sp. TFC3]
MDIRTYLYGISPYGHETHSGHPGSRRDGVCGLFRHKGARTHATPTDAVHRRGDPQGDHAYETIWDSYLRQGLLALPEGLDSGSYGDQALGEVFADAVAALDRPDPVLCCRPSLSIVW